MLRTILSRWPTPAIPKTLPAISLLPSYSFSSRRREKSNDGDSDGDDEAGSGSFFLLNDDPEAPPRLLVVQPRLLPESLLRSKLSEALNLANSLEDPRDRLYAEDFASKETPPHLVVQNPAVRSRKADTYFGPGTVENIECHIRALESKGQLDAVFVNTILSGTQQRNLEMAWKKPVLDRVGLIIDIFNAHAKTKEAKLQTELAVLIYRKSRLGRVRGLSGRLAFGTSGETEVVSARGRGSGGRGFISGAGETELQLQRRRIHEQKNYILSQLKEVRRTRGVQRYARKRHGGSCGQGLATVAVVGYTNAGKSTLVSALSKSDVYSDDRLFATLDPRLRSVVLPSGRKVLLCDTVGFISDLPVQLVEAFHATLEEVVEADLLLHVLDASAPDLDEQRATVLEVLQQIGVSKEKIHNMIEVWNKIDLLDKDKGASGTLEEDERCCGGAEGCETIPGDDCSSETEEEGFETISGDECPSGGQEQYETISGEECLGGVEEETISEGEDGFNSNQDEHNMASDLSLEENLENIHDQESLEQKGMTDLNISPGVKDGHLEISAVTRIGLRELLNVIDKKLIKQKSFVTKSLGPFDRKWRPSFATDTEKVAQQ